MILPDYLDRGLDVVFCGTAVGKKSAEVRHYYAQAGNTFWGTLHGVGLTPVLLAPEQDGKITKYRLGLTDLVKLHAGNDADLRGEMYDIEGFERKIRECAPRFVAFTSKTAAVAYFDLSDTSEVNYGLQRKTIANARVTVLPSTSGRARRHWNETFWSELAAMIRAG